MNTPKFSLKELKDRVENGELDLSLSTLAEDDVPVEDIKKLKKVTALDLSNNVMSYFPMELCSLVSLTRLDVSKNQIIKLPDDIGDLVNLVHLDLLGNKLTTLPESFGNLKSLRWLDVKDNPLTPVLKREAGDCLDDSQCKTCAFKLVKMMAHTHNEFEKRRAEERKRREEEEKLQTEIERENKKKAKLEEKARKKAEYLAAQQRKQQQQKPRKFEEDSDASARDKTSGDSNAERKSKTKNTSKENHIKSAEATITGITNQLLGVSEGISFLSILLLVLAVSLSAVLGLYFYCQSQKENNPACSYPATLAVGEFVETKILPNCQLLQHKALEMFEKAKESYHRYMVDSTQQPSPSSPGQ